MNKLIVLLILFINIQQFNAQNTFDLLIQTEQDEIVNNTLELENGDIIICGGVGNEFIPNTTVNGYFAKLSSTGELLFEKRINLPDNFLNFQKLFYKDENSFIAFAISGEITAGYSNKILYQVYDFEFNLLISKTMNLPTVEDISILRIKPFKMSDNNYILTGTTHTIENGYDNYEAFFYKVSEEGDSINSNFLNTVSLLFTGHSIIEKKNNTGYYALVHGYLSPGQVFNLNYDLEMVSYIEIPDKIGNSGEIKWFNDTSYILTGIDMYDKKSWEQDFAVIILDTLHNIIYNKDFGSEPDTIDWPAPFNSLIYEEDDEFVYLAGVSNFSKIHPWGVNGSYIHFIKTDRQLEPVFENFYKGDAYYAVLYFNQLNDGGFIFLTTRYDYETQNEERDIYILKVDADGNLPASIKDPKIKAHELILYPNPGSNILNIRTAVQRIGGEFTMYDILGKLVFQQSIIESITTINTEHLPSGAYIYNYTHEGVEIESGKWVKE